jgi:hypothetical protein
MSDLGVLGNSVNIRRLKLYAFPQKKLSVWPYVRQIKLDLITMKKLKDIIESSINIKQQLLENKDLLQMISVIVDKIVIAFRNGNRVYFCGNGGSAADAQHLAAEFSGRFYSDRKALPAEACIAILHTSLQWPTITVLIIFIQD